MSKTIQKKETVSKEIVLEKLKLQNVKVIFANLAETEKGFKPSITIDATDDSVKTKISEWVKANNVGKETPGVAKFKEYTPEDSDTTTLQYKFNINDFTKYYGVNGLEKKDLGYGAIIDFVANPFEWENKFGKGISSSLSAVLIKEKGQTGADADMEELLSELEDNSEETIEPIDAFAK